MASLLISAAVNIGASILLNALFGSKKKIVNEGPRLEDKQVTSSAYGEAIPIVYGTDRLAGNIIWSPGLVETVHETAQEQGGKGGGGPKVVNRTFSYSVSFALSMARGGPGTRATRMWADGKLIYDITGSSQSIGKPFTFRLYDGDETQLPDPLIEADKGVGNTPAYRGTAYIVFENFQLADYGNRIPSITVELTFNFTQTLPFEGFTLLPGANIPGAPTGAGTGFMRISRKLDSLYMIKQGVNGLSRSSISTHNMITQNTGSGLFTSGEVGSDGDIYHTLGGGNSTFLIKRDGISLEEVARTATDELSNIGGSNVINAIEIGDPDSGIDTSVLAIALPVLGGIIFYDANGFGVGGLTRIGTDLTIKVTGGDSLKGPSFRNDETQTLYFWQQWQAGASDPDKNVLFKVSMEIGFNASGTTFAKPEAIEVARYSKSGGDFPGTGFVGHCVIPTENAVLVSDSVGTVKIDLETGAIIDSTLAWRVRGGESNVSSTGRYAVAEGDLTSGTITEVSTSDLSIIEVYDIGLAGMPGAESVDESSQVYDPVGHSIIFSRIDISSAPVPSIVQVFVGRGTGGAANLDAVVLDVATSRTQLVPANLDVTALAGETVQGFKIGNESSARQALEPLSTAFTFEGVETDFVIKIVKRGGSPVLTVPEQDLGRADERDFLKEVRTQEVELPERVSVKYIDPDIDYGQGLQFSKRIIEPAPLVRSREQSTVTLPIVLNKDVAKQLSEKLLISAWEERVSIQTVLPWRYIRLDPTDVINLNFRGEIRKMRIAQIEIGADLSLRVLMTQEDARTFISSVLAGVSDGFLQQFIQTGLASRPFILDIPLLSSADATLGISNRLYWAGAGFDDTWPGAILFNSLDNGQTWSNIGATAIEAAWGYVKGIIPDGRPSVWDDLQTIDLVVTRGLDEFVNSTDQEVLAGANTIVVITPSGPEIISFVNATILDAITVRLSRIIRGRLGTENHTDDHTASNPWVLLKTGGSIVRTLIPFSQVNITTKWRMVTLNTLFEDTSPFTQTIVGRSSQPYSPAQLSHIRDDGASEDIVLSWERRTRTDNFNLDGNTIVPLNEAFERYEIDFINPFNNEVIFTETVNDAKTFTLTQANFNTKSGLAAGDQLLQNQGFEGPSFAGFTSGGVALFDARELPVTIGAITYTAADTGTAAAVQIGTGSSNFAIANGPTILLADLGYEVAQDLEGVTMAFSVRTAFWAPTATATEVRLEFRDSVGIISTSFLRTVLTTQGVYETVLTSAAVPAGTDRIRLEFIGEDGDVFDPPWVSVDTLKLNVGVSIPAMLVRVYQISEGVGRGEPASLRLDH